ncbi:MAG: phosphoribosylamine--glycine ligase [bacterium]
MDILLIGRGGREHALAWKISQSPFINRFYCAPGSDAISAFAECVPIDDTEIEDIAAFAAQKNIDLVVVGPEIPLAAGLTDALAQRQIPCFGPSKAAAQLESSKGFVKQLCDDYNIPTAKYGRFCEATLAKGYLKTMQPPYVIKADGLAAGKGVVIADSIQIAEIAIDDMLSGQFGTAGAEIVIEEFLQGDEASFFVLTDGEKALPLIAAQDHKRAFDGDLGPNTGGMGAYSPTPIFSEQIYQQTMDEIIRPTIAAMRDKGTPYRGVLFAGLMITEAGPKLIEYNARFGDPECQVLMRRLQSDLLPILNECAHGQLTHDHLKWSDQACALVVMAANGYPGAYKKGSEIKNTDAAEALDDVVLFHAGTKKDDYTLRANGGRVLNITATGATAQEAITKAYQAVEIIDWPDGYYRKDIGGRLLQT